MATLEWGQTPWDNMTQKELVRECQRMYAALVGLNSVVKMHRASDQMRAGMDPESDDPPNPYWGKTGVGGNELEKARQVLEPLHEKYGQTEIYRAFFRYANDLLFEKNGFQMIVDNWVICPECGAMYGSRTTPFDGKLCSSEPFGKKGCAGTLRRLTWEDIRPKP